MSDCRDKQIERLLYPYELGMLSEQEAERVELHILDCDSCREKVAHLSRAMEVVRRSDELKQHIRKLDEADTVIEKAPVSRSNIWRIAAPVAAAILLIVFLLDWQIDIRPGQKAVAAQNRLVILPFSNDADPADSSRIGEITANLLITDFTESRFIQVVSRERLFDVQRQLELSDTTRQFEADALRIARATDARWVMTGRILQTTPQLIVSAQIIDVATGDTYISKRIQGAKDDQIFAVVDSLSAQVKSELALPDEAEHEFDPAVADVTTHSADAYRHYVEGVKDYLKYYYDDAVKDFDKALQYDSTFAMAYYYLSQLKDRKLIQKALDYSDQANFREKLYIRAAYESVNNNGEAVIPLLRRLIERYPDEKVAHFRIGYYFYIFHEYDSSIAHMQTALDLDPHFAAPLNILAYVYEVKDETEKSLEALDRYIKLVPEEATPYYSKGNILARHGDLAGAIETYKISLERKADFTAATYSMAMMYLFIPDFDSSAAYCRRLMSAEHPVDRASGRYILSLNEIFKGNTAAALSILDDAIAADRLEGYTGHEREVIALACLTEAWLYAERNQFDAAMTAMDSCDVYSQRREENVYFNPHVVRALLLIDNGFYGKAQTEIDNLRELFSITEKGFTAADFCEGYLELAKGNADEALRIFDSNEARIRDFIHEIVSARAEIETGKYPEAINRLERIEHTYTRWRAFWWPWTQRLPYYLGRAYEANGDTEQAIAQYQYLIVNWGHTDITIADVEDARRRLDKLQNRL
ncbi:MAG: tetratricopeptide repeat protein [Candidatus Zixiibacteriota bacterium]